MPDQLLRFMHSKPPWAVNRVLQNLLRDAYQNVPHYRALMTANGVTPEDIQSPSDLPRLPLTTKAALLKGGQASYLHSNLNPARSYDTGTSGSQGIPLAISFSRTEAFWRTAMLWRTMARYTRLTPPLTVADVGPISHHAGNSVASRTPLLRLLRLPATLPLETQINDLSNERPTVVEGYPTCLELLGQVLAERGPIPWRPRLVVSRGEVLHQETRAFLERVFHCPVADLYNCEEMGNVAWSCPEHANRWHINTDACIVEIVDANGIPLPPGVEGRILLTSLFGRAMPFLRYDIGDSAAMLPPAVCSCGARGPALTNLDGRDDDFLSLPDGRRIPPRLAATTVFNVFSAKASKLHMQPVRQFQIVQRGFETLRLRVVLSDSNSASVAHEAAMALASLGMPCEVEMLDTIPLAPSGKFKKVLAIP